MIKSSEALDIVLQHTFVPSTERIDFSLSHGRVLAEDILANEAIPPYDRVAMDGIAVHHDDPAIALGGELRCSGIQAAGVKPLVMDGNGHCIEVMTGAVCPTGADAIVPYEHLEVLPGGFRVLRKGIQVGQNIHTMGSDRKQGDVLIPCGTVISAAEIGCLAASGHVLPKVKRTPSVALFSSGNELVEPSQSPLPHQLRRSNVFMLQAMLRELGINPVLFSLRDDKEEMSSIISNATRDFDVLLLSGAVSKGKFDFLPGVLKAEGAEKLFHGVEQKPGKPFWFGTTQRTQIFAFPGNPVSSLVCFTVYFLPWFHRSMGTTCNELWGKFTAPCTSHPELTLFVQVKVERKVSGSLMLQPIPGGGSGDFSNLVRVDGFAEIPPNESHTDASRNYRLHLFRRQ